jgi:hypothetical protein
MRKKTIAILFIIGIVLSAIGGGLEGAGAAAMANGGSSILAILGGLLAGVGAICALISWIGALVATGKQGRWGWFVVVFILSGLGELIYLIAGPALQ